MQRRDKAQLLESIVSGETTVSKLRQQSVKFILPCNGRDDTGYDWQVTGPSGTRHYTNEQFIKLKISYCMNREEIIKRIQAMQSGGIEAIARPLPVVWCKRFAKDELLKEVKSIYGPAAKIIYKKGTPFVISDNMAMWHFFDHDGIVEYGHGDNRQTFTKDEYDSIVADLEKEENKFMEVKSYTRILHWVQQPGNEPLECDWDYGPDKSADQQPTIMQQPEQPKKEPVKPLVTVQKEVEDLHEVKPEPDRPTVIKLSTWKSQAELDRERSEKMDQWKNINNEFQ